MKITNPISFLTLGGRMRYLMGRSNQDLVFGDGFILDNLNEFKKDLSELGFTVSKNLYNFKVLPIEKELLEIETLYNNKESEGRIIEKQANDLTHAIAEMENTVLAEAQTRIIATPIPRRFILNHLLENHGEILGKGVYDLLTAQAQYDINQACKCIAFECPTAAAFHILRAIEECVRILFRAYFPRGDSGRARGCLTSELKNKPKNPKPDDTLMAHLDHLRVRFRNPTDHPEKIYEIEEAEDLIHLAVDIINRCIKDEKVNRKLS